VIVMQKLDYRVESLRLRHVLRGFTLIELLVVLFIFLLLTSIALPTVKNLLADQKLSKAARSVTGFFSVARSRAIAEGRLVGVRIERLGGTNTASFNEAASLRLRYLIGIPPYSGDAADSKVFMENVAANGRVTLVFNKNDNQLLSLINMPNPAFQTGDLIELPGGKLFALEFPDPQTGPFPDTEIYAVINLRAPLNGSSTYPSGDVIAGNRSMSYRIHRRPIVSSVAPLDFVRDVAIDLNLSGFGNSGFQFAPNTTDASQPVDILFGPEGQVAQISLDSAGNLGPAPGLVFLCLGSTDGIRASVVTTEANAFTVEGKAKPNLLSEESIWIVINPNTGRVVAAPFGSVTDTSSRANALPFARSLALLSDTLDAAP
jgi:prepilin-type N-terminal cleavage/methylation domain-containing protein